MNKLIASLAVLACLLAVSMAASKTYTPADSDFATDLAGLTLSPGDVITFAASSVGGSATYDFAAYGGTYALMGSLTKPITITARAGDSITFTTTDSGKNILQFSGSYFVINGIRFTNTAAAPDSQAVRLMPDTSHAVIQNLYVHDMTTNPITANTAPGVYTNITFRYNVVDGTDGTGECFYVGCQPPNNTPGGTPGCKISNSLFEYNYCAHTCVSGSCGGSGGSGFQIKHGSYNNIVRNNVCYQTNTPCILFYDDYDQGVNIADGNLIWNTKSDSGIQLAAGGVIRNNVIFGSANDGITITNNVNDIQAGKANRNVQVIHNTVINNAARGIRFVAGMTASSIINNVALGNGGGDYLDASVSGITFKNNAYNDGKPSAGTTAQFIAVGTASAELTNPVDGSSLNLYPKADSGLLSAGAAGYVGYDFDFRYRNTCGPSIGAYEYVAAAASPRWALAQAKKVVSGAATPCGVGASCTTSCTPTAPTSAAPKAAPTAVTPVAAPKAAPVAAPKAAPVAVPVAAPKAAPTAAPKAAPTAAPKAAPTAAPKAAPVATTPTTAPRAATPTATPTTTPRASTNPTSASTPTTTSNPTTASTPAVPTVAGTPTDSDGATPPTNAASASTWSAMTLIAALLALLL